MTLKMIGAEFKSFLADELIWVGDTYMDDTEIYIDGNVDDGNVEYEKLPDDAEVVIKSGLLVVPNKDVPGKDIYKDLVSVASKWREAQSLTFVTFGVPKTDLLKVLKKLTELGISTPEQLRNKNSCPNDTDGDGNCGRPMCPLCSPRWHRS